MRIIGASVLLENMDAVCHGSHSVATRSLNKVRPKSAPVNPCPFRPVPMQPLASLTALICSTPCSQSIDCVDHAQSLWRRAACARHRSVQNEGRILGVGALQRPRHLVARPLGPRGRCPCQRESLPILPVSYETRHVSRPVHADDQLALDVCRHARAADQFH